MKKSNSSKFIWLVIGAIVGSTISLSFDEFIRPLFQAEADIIVSAKKVESGIADIRIKNQGNSIARNIDVTSWTYPTDIINVEPSVGIADAECDVGLYKASEFGRNENEIQTPLNTSSWALRVECKKIRPEEEWRGRIEYRENQSADYLTTYIKYPEKSTERTTNQF